MAGCVGLGDTGDGNGVLHDVSRAYRMAAHRRSIGDSSHWPLDSDNHMRKSDSPTRPVIFFTELESMVGQILIGVYDHSVCFLEFLDEGRRDRQIADADLKPGECGLLAAARQQLAEYFSGTRQKFDLPLGQPGTQFQSTVWRALTEIPYGRTCSYGDIARRIGNPAATRAVGSANGRNQIPIIVPCHRVVSSDGSLGGFSSGLWRKQKLLELEARTTALI
jgi:O-6-methylguanine DNA methyltransferase